MKKRAARSTGKREPRLRPTPSIVLAGAALFIVLGGSAVAATGLIQAGDIAPGAVTSKAIRNGGVEPRDLSTGTRALLEGRQGVTGDTGLTGTAGTQGAEGARGSNGANGAEGAKGSNGANGANGPNGANGAEGAKGSNGANGANGPNGANGANGVDGTNGTNGIDGAKGTNGTNGTISPLSATKGLTALPTAGPPTTVIELAVPAGNYVVLAATELSHTGAGDSVECSLKAGMNSTTLPPLNLGGMKKQQEREHESQDKHHRGSGGQSGAAPRPRRGECRAYTWRA